MLLVNMLLNVKPLYLEIKLQKSRVFPIMI
jgi:hypothetical protein